MKKIIYIEINISLLSIAYPFQSAIREDFQLPCRTVLRIKHLVNDNVFLVFTHPSSSFVYSKMLNETIILVNFNNFLITFKIYSIIIIVYKLRIRQRYIHSGIPWIGYDERFLSNEKRPDYQRMSRWTELQVKRILESTFLSMLLSHSCMYPRGTMCLPVEACLLEFVACSFSNVNAVEKTALRPK